MIYSTYGFSKGKTTSAIGITARALANGERVLFAQFLKDFKDGGVHFLHDSSTLHWMAQGTKGFTKEDCNEFGELVFQDVINNKYDLVVLDEVLVALDNDLIDYNLFSDIINYCTVNNIDVYLTGRINNGRLRHQIEELSDIATDMRSDRHCFDKLCSGCNRTYPHYFKFCPNCGEELPNSIQARKGREY